MVDKTKRHRQRCAASEYFSVDWCAGNVQRSMIDCIDQKEEKKNRFEHKQKHVCLSLKKPCALQRSTCLLFEVHCCFV
uniref:Uncharacterized protein n=1 Tax=Aegilops tauschii subsp. strangulata TaxID=200361 RepID=A0A453DXA7_AEGTS